MPKRIFGTENEYSLVKKYPNGQFEAVRADGNLMPVLENAGSYEPLRRYKVISKTNNTSEKRFWLASNGGQFYFDAVGQHSFPEYATPECDSAKLAVTHDKAGERFVNEVRRMKNVDIFKEHGGSFLISKNTTFYGSHLEDDVGYVGVHENYMTKNLFNPHRTGTDINQPDPSSKKFCDFLMPFLISRVVIHGGGGVRWSPELGWHYVLSQRAFALKKEISITASDRPLVNFKQEHTPPDYARLHLLYSDPNMSPFAAFLKIGTTHLVLSVFEENPGIRPPVMVSNPLFTICKFSKDVTLKAIARDNTSGREYTAVQLQKEYLNIVLRTLVNLSKEEQKIIELWAWTLKKLEENPEELYRYLDWVTKRHFLNLYLNKIKADLSSAQARTFDFLYSDISKNGFYNKLRAGGFVEEFITDEEIDNALLTPPPTRAFIRSRYLQKIIEKGKTEWSTDWHHLNITPSFALTDPFAKENAELENFLALL